ncbi:MAG TPA: hypothetical protein VHT30_00460 [Acidimicrobiales bacterium]|jgi:hypothetical protein|nr:hypothetical protein [Acidimicrobiales bacterium]
MQRRERHRLTSAAVGLAVAAVFSSALAACGSSSKGFGQLTTDGTVRVIPAKGSSHLVHTGNAVHAGDVIQVMTGSAAVQFQPSGVVQLRKGSEISLGDPFRLLSGSALLEPIGRTLQLATNRATLVMPGGAAQLTMAADGSVVAKVYQSTARLDVAGGSAVSISAPREVDLSSSPSAPVQVVPLRYQDTDSWDHVYLAGPEQISTQLGAAVTGFNAQVPAGEGENPAFYQMLEPQLASRSDFIPAFEAVAQNAALPSSATMPGDYLIASIIALRGTHGSFEQRMTGELAFFAQGAPWGFVAYDQGVSDLTGVLNDMLTAIGRAKLPVTGPSAPQITIAPPSATVSTPPPTIPSRGSSSPTTTTTIPVTPGRVQNPPPATTTTEPPVIQLPLIPGPLGNILNPLLDPILQALNNILSGKG